MGTWRPIDGSEDRKETARVGRGKRLILPDPGPVGLALIKKITLAEKLTNDLEEIALIKNLKAKGGIDRLHGAANIATQKLTKYGKQILKKAQDLAILHCWINELENWEMPPTYETSPARTVLEVYDHLGDSIVDEMSSDMVQFDSMQINADLDKILNHKYSPKWPADPRVARWRGETTELKRTLNDENARTEEARTVVEESWPGGCIEQNLAFQSAFELSDDIRMCLQFIALIEIALDRYERGPIGPKTCLRVAQMLGRVKEQVQAIEKLRAEETSQETDARRGGAGGGGWLI